ncbi:MAG: hypothetical protein E7592_05040 [Ruminococcaceae bacterium]|nr:hypothetical protein [Oscillospiraceae bacterium]
MNQRDLPKRKHPRLKIFDYSSTGAYFVTICTQNRKCVLSQVVGRGLAPAATNDYDVPNGENIVQIQLTAIGKIVEQQLLLLEERYACLEIPEYVIMPNHIHIVFVLNNETAGASPRPTIMDIVCAFKSLTTLECKKTYKIDKLFQTSFFEHVIRDRNDYNGIVKYIYENPAKWHYDDLYADD